MPVLHALFAAIPAGQPAWIVMKDRLGTQFGLSDDTMHMGVGLALLTLAAFVLRRPPWTLRPWLVVLAAELLNEAYDLTSGAEEGNWSGSLRDVAVTLLWPTLVLIVWRRWSTPYAAARPASAEALDQTLDHPLD